MGQPRRYTAVAARSAGRRERRRDADALLGGGCKLKSLKRLIIEKTEGNPFFMEEMVQALFEQGVLVRNGATKADASR